MRGHKRSWDLRPSKFQHRTELTNARHAFKSLGQGNFWTDPTQNKSTPKSTKQSLTRIEQQDSLHTKTSQNSIGISAKLSGIWLSSESKTNVADSRG